MTDKRNEQIVEIGALPEEEAVDILMNIHNMSESEARFVYGLERGEYEGDTDVVED